VGGLPGAALAVARRTIWPPRWQHSGCDSRAACRVWKSGNTTNPTRVCQKARYLTTPCKQQQQHQQHKRYRRLQESALVPSWHCRACCWGSWHVDCSGISICSRHDLFSKLESCHLARKRRCTAAAESGSYTGEQEALLSTSEGQECRI